MDVLRAFNEFTFHFIEFNLPHWLWTKCKDIIRCAIYCIYFMIVCVMTTLFKYVMKIDGNLCTQRLPHLSSHKNDGKKTTENNMNDTSKKEENDIFNTQHEFLCAFMSKLIAWITVFVNFPIIYRRVWYCQDHFGHLRWKKMHLHLKLTKRWETTYNAQRT